MAVTEKQIKKAEEDFLAIMEGSMGTDAANLARDGKIKFIIDNDELVMVGPKDPAYHSEAAFNTPREAEHFTSGYGREPGRSSIGKFVGSAVAPVSQTQIADRIRREQRELLPDIAQDVISTSRYFLPLVSAGSPIAGATMAGLGALGLGGIGKGISEARGESWYGETPENIALTAAAAAAGAGANRFFAPEELRKRQMEEKVAEKLGISKEDVRKDVGLVKDIEAPLEAQSASLPEYKFGDWKRRPLKQFDTETGAQEMPLRMKRLPMVYQSATSPVPMKRAEKVVDRKTGKTVRQSVPDEVALRFVDELGIARNDVKLDQVKAFLDEAWLRPLSDKGVQFYPTKSTGRDFTKKQWTKARAVEPSEFVYDLYASQAEFPDKEMDAQWQKAKAEFGKRMKKVSGKEKTPIITPKEYSKMGEYGERGSLKSKFLRKGLRGLGTVGLPIATEVFGKHLINKFGGKENE